MCSLSKADSIVSDLPTIQLIGCLVFPFAIVLPQGEDSRLLDTKKAVKLLGGLNSKTPEHGGGLLLNFLINQLKSFL